MAKGRSPLAKSGSKDVQSGQSEDKSISRMEESNKEKINMIPNLSSPLQKLSICLDILKERRNTTAGLGTPIFLIESVIKEMQEEKKSRLEKMIIPINFRHHK